MPSSGNVGEAEGVVQTFLKLSPEIRSVMDRMLASDQEIAEARSEMNYAPLFEAKPLGMSDADYTAYASMSKRGAEQAERKLLEKTMAVVRREKEAWFKGERKAVKAEVEAELSTRREYRLINLLANGKWDAEGEAPDVRLDRAALIEQFGEGILSEISRSRIGGRRAIYGSNGISPEEAAAMFGFDSPGDMLEVLQNTVKFKEAVSRETERRLLELHGDPLNDGSIEEEAVKAVHATQQQNATIVEARQLAAQLGRSTRPMRAKIYRHRAKMMIANMSVREAMRPSSFLQAERRAARKAQDAFARVARGNGKDTRAALAEALQAKEQQILNSYLYDEALKVEKEINRIREKARSYLKPSVRKKLDGGYIEQIDAILEDYDFRVRGARQVARAESLKEFVDRMIAEDREAELAIDPRLLEEASKRHYSRLSVDELRGLADTIENLAHLGRHKQDLITAQRKRKLDESRERVAATIETNIGTGKAEKQSAIRSFLNLALTADTILANLDGGEEIGAVYDEIKRDIDKGQVEEQRMSVEMQEGVEALFSVYSAKERAEMQKKQVVSGGNGHAWSKVEILAAALNTGNADNMQRLLDPSVVPSRRLTSDQLHALLDTLDQRDWDFVQSMWDYIDGYWPQLSEVEYRRTGVRPTKVEAAPVQTMTSPT